MRERIIRGIVGSLVLIGVLLGLFVNIYWYIVPVFVSVNLLQSSVTRWCLLDKILKSQGIVD